MIQDATVAHALLDLDQLELHARTDFTEHDLRRAVRVRDAVEILRQVHASALVVRGFAIARVARALVKKFTHILHVAHVRRVSRL